MRFTSSPAVDKLRDALLRSNAYERKSKMIVAKITIKLICTGQNLSTGLKEQCREKFVHQPFDLNQISFENKPSRRI